ncbi:hypothetical protein [Methanoregula sp.]|jgi:hypothetical protein|uniref:hypothetical protein n=1 Tax=Methanoregula sp. TaxID=2052170 RepID=UPI002621D163|nr:hypothetical protein [Methanoregula sp.]MDD5143353.1 hypothetical protein [Methanoregula sp.]
MKTRETILAGTGLVVAVLLAGCMVLGLEMTGIADSGYFRPPAPDNALSPAALPEDNESIALDCPLPQSPATVPQYRVVSLDRNSMDSGTALTVKSAIPSVEDAPALAEKALAAYGGLPEGAVREKTEQVFLNQYNLATGMTEERFPQYTLVTYRQYVNNTPVMNTGISVELGEEGELVGLSGQWSVLEPNGTNPIIAPDAALRKLRDGDLLRKPQCCMDGSRIVQVGTGYYILEGTHDPPPPARVITQDACIPVWAFYVVKPGAETEPFPLLVDARDGEQR